jgi:hypothetical protein
MVFAFDENPLTLQQQIFDVQLIKVFVCGLGILV